MNRRGLGLLLLAVGFMSPLFGEPAVACLCSSGSEVDTDDYLRQAAIIFEGEPISVAADGGAISVTFRVVTPLKGDLGGTVTLDQAEPGMCMAAFEMGKRSPVVAYGNHAKGYATSSCAQQLIESGDRSKDIYQRALKNRERTVALSGSDQLPPNAGLLRDLIRWLSEYHSFEEGLKATDRLLAIEPNDREALLFKAEFLSALDEDTEALRIAERLLAKDDGDHEANRRRAISLARLDRSSEIPADWTDFRGLEASNVDLGGRKMQGISLRDAAISEGDFSQSDMRGGDLMNASLWSSNLSGADLSRANLVGASLESSRFNGANLSGANLSTARASGDFSGADLRGAVALSASFDGFLVSVDARGIVLAGSNVEAYLANADLSGADLRMTTFGPDAVLAGANLRNADLRGAIINSTTIRAADLAGAIFDDRTVFPSGFDPVAAGAKRID